MNAFASHGHTIRHTHSATLALGGGLVMTTKRDGTDERANLRLDVYDSCDPTAILIVTSGEGEPDDLDRAQIILNHEQIAGLVAAGEAFLKQYPHGIESARRLERMRLSEDDPRRDPELARRLAQ